MQPSPPPSPPPYEVNENVKFALDVAPTEFGALVGKSGVCLKELRTKWAAVAITIPRSTAAAGSKVTLEGPRGVVEQVVTDVEAILMLPVTYSEVECGFDMQSHSDWTHCSNESSSQGTCSVPSIKRLEYLPQGVASLQSGHVPHPEDWTCPMCGNVNWAGRWACNRCKTRNPAAGHGSGRNSKVSRIITDPLDRSASSSSPGCTPEDGMLDGEGWTPAAGDAAPWYIIDSGSQRVVCGVVVKGGVHRHTLAHSANGVEWCRLTPSAGSTAAPNVTNFKPVTTRYVKMTPVEGVGLRVGLVMCALETAVQRQSDDAARVAAKEKLMNFFARHNPGKLENIESILDHCDKAGVGYAVLYRKLEAKYTQRAKTKAIVLDVGKARTLTVKARWEDTAVAVLKGTIASEWGIQPEHQILTTTLGLELTTDTNPCSHYGVGADLPYVLLLDTLHIEDAPDSDDDVISL